MLAIPRNFPFASIKTRCLACKSNLSISQSGQMRLPCTTRDKASLTLGIFFFFFLTNADRVGRVMLRRLVLTTAVVLGVMWTRPLLGSLCRDDLSSMCQPLGIVPCSYFAVPGFWVASPGTCIVQTCTKIPSPCVSKYVLRISTTYNVAVENTI